jgi:hypothetical protein
MLNSTLYYQVDNIIKSWAIIVIANFYKANELLHEEQLL